MKVIVFSDSHGYHDNLEEAVKAEGPFDQAICLGDTENKYYAIEGILNCPVAFVSGNCDWGADFPDEKTITVGGVKIFMTHGHHYKVQYGLQMLEYQVGIMDVDVAFFGHTHKPHEGVAGKAILFNPGSISFPRTEEGIPSYAVMEIENGQIKSLEHRFLEA